MTNKKKLNATEAQAEFQSQMSQISMGMCKVTVRELIKGYYRDFMNFDDAVIAYNKQLQISPKYTDAFDYKKEQRDRIIRTMLMGLPLDTMYWIDRGKQYENDPNEPRYELLDGQMRANVIYDYVAGGFSILCNGNPLYFFNMTSDAQDAILCYELSVCICDGRHPEKLEKLKLEKEQVNKKKQRIRKTASEQNVYDDEYIYLILSGWFNKYAKPILSVLCLLHHTDEDVKCGFRPYDEDISPEVMRNTFNEAILKFGQASYMMKTGGLTDSMIKTGVIDSMIKTDSMIKYYNSTCEMLEGWSWRAIVYDMLKPSTL